MRAVISPRMRWNTFSRSASVPAAAAGSSKQRSSSSSSAAVLVGTWVSESLFVAFRQHVSSRVDENRSEGEVEYWLSRRVSVDGTIGDRGYNGVDLLWRKRY